MRVLLLIFLGFLHLIVTKKIKTFWVKKANFSPFKGQTMLAPFDILLSLLFIYLIGLSFSQSGIAIGNWSLGIRLILLLGIPLVLLNIGLIFAVPEDKLNEISFGQGDLKWQLIYVIFLVGPMEELFYRGFIQGTLSTMMDGKLYILSYAAILGSFIFVLVHIGNVFKGDETMSAFISMLPQRLFISLILAYSFQATNSLIYPVIIHNLIDTAAILTISYRKNNTSHHTFTS